MLSFSLVRIFAKRKQSSRHLYYTGTQHYHVGCSFWLWKNHQNKSVWIPLCSFSRAFQGISFQKIQDFIIYSILDIWVIKNIAKVSYQEEILPSNRFNSLQNVLKVSFQTDGQSFIEIFISKIVSFSSLVAIY